jgi:hypothetical protein
VNRTRHSQVTHYFFEGCRVYFPLMMGEDGHIFWQYPEWVHDPPPQGTTAELADVIRQNVPEGATVVIAGDTAAEVDLKGRETLPLPQPEVAELERLREAGAKYIVLPRDQMPAMEFFPTFQEHLEDRYRTVFRDGGYCAIYALD